MTKENKDLLLKDLCARLPYGVKIATSLYQYGNVSTIKGIVGEKCYFNDNPRYDGDCPIEEVKPYLRPMSSMTGVEVLEYLSLKESIVAIDDITYSFETYKSIEWLNKNMFDYRGLIPMELAIDATGLNIY